MKLTVTHTLRYSLGTPARAVQHVLLTALGTPQQKVERWSIEMPGFADAATFRDGFGNRAQLVSLVKPDAELVVVVSGAVETMDKAGVLGRLEYDPPPAMFRRPTELTKPDPALIETLKDGPDR
ncbi:MAG: transglutaminase N-terminal domain-containing protein, partial [Devosia sp.]